MNDFHALVLFNVFVLVMLALDLGVFHRRPRAVTLREAALWSTFWVALALMFNVGVYLWRGPEAGLEFLTAYVLEKSLSMDNVFVFAAIFGYTAVPKEYQHRVLFWGVLGALVMRGAFIAAGVAAVAHFHWVLYLFGVFLVVTGGRLLFTEQRTIPAERNPLVRMARKVFPLTERYEGGSFWVRAQGRLYATPLLLVLLMVETTDILFALDSIPAVFAVTEDAFIIYTSNVLAILGLRAMYFLLAGAMARLHHLRAGLSLVLIFVGTKMVIAPIFKIPVLVALGGITAVLGAAVLASLLTEKKAASQASVERG